MQPGAIPALINPLLKDFLCMMLGKRILKEEKRDRVSIKYVGNDEFQINLISLSRSFETLIHSFSLAGVYKYTNWLLLSIAYHFCVNILINFLTREALRERNIIN